METRTRRSSAPNQAPLQPESRPDRSQRRPRRLEAALKPHSTSAPNQKLGNYSIIVAPDATQDQSPARLEVRESAGRPGAAVCALARGGNSSFHTPRKHHFETNQQTVL
ncbi:hypothetical protein SRHO_G00325980 [Serrasalmus rhombeus]